MTYYKPRDIFMCCYYSQTYDETYADGYGLNFYTHEYGYYEYNNCDKDIQIYNGMIVLSVFAVIAICVLCGIIFCIKRNCCDDKKSTEEEATVEESEAVKNRRQQVYRAE